MLFLLHFASLPDVHILLFPLHISTCTAVHAHVNRLLVAFISVGSMQLQQYPTLVVESTHRLIFVFEFIFQRWLYHGFTARYLVAARLRKSGGPTLNIKWRCFVRVAARPILAAFVVRSEVPAADLDAAVGEKGEKAEEADLQVPPCCEREECRERANEGCRKKLACGHPCRGPGERQKK